MSDRRLEGPRLPCSCCRCDPVLICKLFVIRGAIDAEGRGEEQNHLLAAASQKHSNPDLAVAVLPIEDVLELACQMNPILLQYSAAEHDRKMVVLWCCLLFSFLLFVDELKNLVYTYRLLPPIPYAVVELFDHLLDLVVRIQCCLELSLVHSMMEVDLDPNQRMIHHLAA